MSRWYIQELIDNPLEDEINREFFQAVVVSKLFYSCTTYTLTKYLEKKLDAECYFEQILEAAA